MNDFNAKYETENIIEFIRDYYRKNNLGGVILGISGGKDSAIVAALFVKAIGKENVIGVAIPCHSNLEDMVDAKFISDYYGFEFINFDITSTFDTFKIELSNLGKFSELDTKNSDINIKPRLRMLTLYYLAALFNAIRKKVYLVAGTSNKSELYVGYFTKGGDNVHDIAVLADYTVEEVIKIGEYLSVPERVLYKVPSDGLSGLSDEEKLGISYKNISDYLNNKLINKEIINKIEKLHNNSLHKFNLPTYRRK